MGWDSFLGILLLGVLALYYIEGTYTVQCNAYNIYLSTYISSFFKWNNIRKTSIHKIHLNFWSPSTCNIESMWICETNINVFDALKITKWISDFNHLSKSIQLADVTFETFLILFSIDCRNLIVYRNAFVCLVAYRYLYFINNLSMII